MMYCRSSSRGYEFGGLDYVDRSRIPQDSPSHYSYNEDNRKYHDERKTSPGYEMGGMDFRKGAVKMDGPYHGHGPEQRRLQSKFEHASLKHDEMNIEVAPNVDYVSADVLIGDTRSNQHLAKNEQPDHEFGTSFGSTVGFTHHHRTVGRREETPKSTTFSLSAKTDHSAHRWMNNKSHTRGAYLTPPPPRSSHETLPPSTDISGYTSEAVTNYTSAGKTTGSTPYGKSKQKSVRSQSAASTGRQESANENGDKEVTIETLLTDKALIPQKRMMAQEWQTKSLEKHNHWKNRSDPRLTRSQVLYIFFILIFLLLPFLLSNHSLPSIFFFCFFLFTSSNTILKTFILPCLLITSV